MQRVKEAGSTAGERLLVCPCLREERAERRRRGRRREKKAKARVILTEKLACSASIKVSSFVVPRERQSNDVNTIKNATSRNDTNLLEKKGEKENEETNNGKNYK